MTTDTIPAEIMREAADLFVAFETPTLEEVARALLARDKRAAGKATEQAEYCQRRSQDAPDANGCNYWGGCGDTASLIKTAILTYQEGE